LLSELEGLNTDLFVTADPRSVYYCTGSFSAGDSPAIFALSHDGSSLLVTAAAGEALASDVRKLDVYSIRRSIDTPLCDASRLFADALGSRHMQRVAVERAATPGLIEQLFPRAEIVDATVSMLWLRQAQGAG
jgi:hypothetical protein